jgi:hypothetical protein
MRLERAWAAIGVRGRRTERSLVWMLGSPRTGSTWLLNLLKVSPTVVPVDEPAIGSHLGLFAADVMGAHPSSFEGSEMLVWERRRDDRHYFFAAPQVDAWRPALRKLLLDRFATYPGATRRDAVIVVKEPAGSQAAPLLMDLLPSSRLLFLMRDGRDVVDSELAAVQKGGWLAELFGSDDDMGEAERRGFVIGQAHRWVARTEAVGAAYDAHPPALRHLVGYEDLLSNTAQRLREIVDWLRLDVADEALRDHVERLSFQAVPAEKRGTKEFARAATPGLWRQNLTPAEQDVLNEIMGPTLRRHGYEVP